MPEHRPIGFALRHRLRAVPAQPATGQPDTVDLPPQREIARGRRQGRHHLWKVVGVHPFIKKPGVAREVPGLQLHHLAHSIVHIRDRAAAVGVAAYLVDQARHPGRDVLDEPQLASQRLGGLALGGDVLYHAEIGLRIARHGGLTHARAQPALLAIRPRPAELDHPSVQRLTGLHPGRQIIGVDATPPLRTGQHRCGIDPRQLVKTR
ncbi:hypothetical protein FQZ97_930940 [compost metagenome]